MKYRNPLFFSSLIVATSGLGCVSKAYLVKSNFELYNNPPVAISPLPEYLPEDSPVCDWIAGGDTKAVKIVEAAIENKKAVEITGNFGENAATVGVYFGNQVLKLAEELSKGQSYRISFRGLRINEVVNKNNKVDIVARDKDNHEAFRMRFRDGTISTVKDNNETVLGTYDTTKDFFHGILVNLDMISGTYSVSVSQNGKDTISTVNNPVKFTNETFNHFWDLVIEVEANNAGEISSPVKYLLDDLSIERTCRSGTTNAACQPSSECIVGLPKEE